VALRPEHLRRLAAEFQVNSVTCGQQAFVIAEEPRHAAARPSPVARDDAEKAKKELEALASRAKMDSPTQLQPAPAAPAVTSPTAALEAAAEPWRERRTTSAAKTGAEETKNGPAAAAAAPVAAVGGFGGGGARDGRWLECVITMEPRPAKEQGETAVAPAASQRAK
jgi:hypothetical protein